jgi:beta-galactosidase beta subunit
MIFYPDDAHMPQIAVNSPAMVKKAVFKIKI